MTHVDGEHRGATDPLVGNSTPLPAPHGISGGPLWRVETGTPPHEIWVPEKRLALIGIASSYLESERIEFAESVAVFSDWFHETIHMLDSRS